MPLPCWDLPWGQKFGHSRGSSVKFLLKLAPQVCEKSFLKFCKNATLAGKSACRRRTPAVVERLRSNFQRNAYQRLLEQGATPPEFRVRHKLERWALDNSSRHPHVVLSVRQRPPAALSNRCLRNLHCLCDLVPPRVISAVFGVIWNRWTTHRRFQKRQADSNVCQLGCPRTAEDSLEHVREVGTRFLKLHPLQQINAHTFLMCNPQTSATTTTAHWLGNL